MLQISILTLSAALALGALLLATFLFRGRPLRRCILAITVLLVLVGAFRRVYITAANMSNPDLSTQAIAQDLYVLFFLAIMLFIGVIVMHIILRTLEKNGEALAESEARFRGIVENTPAGYFYCDKGGLFQQVNHAWLFIHGYEEAQEVIGKHLSLTWVDEDNALEKEFLATLLGGHAIPTGDGARRCRDGSVAYHSYSAHPVLQAGDVVGIEGFLIDTTASREAERARRETEEKYHAIYENSRDSLTLGDPESGRLLGANPAALEMFKVTEEGGFSNGSPWDFSPEYQPDGRSSEEKGREMFKTALREGGCSFEWTHKRSNGETFLSTVQLARVVVQGKPLILGTVHDITEQKQAEDALRESEEKYHALFEGSRDALMLVSPVSGKFISGNRAALEMFGVKKESDFSAYAPWELSPPEQPDGRSSLEKAWEQINTAADEGVCFFEWTHQRKSGEEFYASVLLTRIMIKGIPVIQATVRDITGKKRSEQALRESEARFNQLAELSRTITWETDAEGLCVYVSSVIKDVLGYDPTDIEHKKYCYDFAPESERDAMIERVSQIIASRAPYREFENQAVTKNGESVWLSSNGIPVVAPNGSFLGYRGMDRDITEQKRMQIEKDRLQEQFVQTQKMECVGRLAGGVAHDFNNKLSIILGYLELVQAQADPNTPMQGWLEKIDHAARSSVNLTRQILAFARKQTIAPQQVNLNSAVEGMLNMLRKLIGEDIELDWQPGDSLSEVSIDPVQIDQILANLLLNARDAIAGNGRITVETSNFHFDEEYCALHPDTRLGDYVMLAVSDTGCGMDKETQANAFEPFFTTKPLGQGTGLGLATVYGIVKQNEGFINVYSEPGRGTIFKIYLPQCLTQAEQEALAATHKQAVGGRETILLVEDETDLLALCHIMLESLGYTVLATDCPKKALQLAEECEGHIDLLVTDVIMPGMNGRELASQLTARFPHIKQLFVSGYTANAIAHRGILDKDVHFIQKPFSTEVLAAKVRKALEEG